MLPALGSGQSRGSAASLLRFMLQMAMNQPPAAPPAWVCNEAGIAEHCQKLHNTDWKSRTAQALPDTAVCTGVPGRSMAVAACAGRGERCFRGEESFVSSLEVARRATVCADAGSQPGSAGHRPASSPSVRPSRCLLPAVSPQGVAVGGYIKAGKPQPAQKKVLELVVLSLPPAFT